MMMMIINISIVLGGGVLHHAAPEWQRVERLRTEVHAQRGVPVVERGEEGLPSHALGQGLRLAGSDPVAEEADRVGVRAALVEIQQDPQDLGAAASLAGEGYPLLLGDEVAVAVEADAVALVSDEEGGASGGEAEAAHGPGGRRRLASPALPVGPGLRLRPGLHRADLEEVAAGLDAHGAPRAGQEVLEAAVAEGHEHLPAAAGHHVQRGVGPADRRRALRDPRPRVLGRVLLLGRLRLLRSRRLLRSGGLCGLRLGVLPASSLVSANSHGLEI